MRRLGLIGLGRIGGAVAEAVAAGRCGSWTMAGILRRTEAGGDGILVTDDPALFFSRDYDLIVEAAGPAVLRAHGVAALKRSDVWTVSAVALADEECRQALATAAGQSGHNLRVLPGAIAGVDAVRATAGDPKAVLHVYVDMPRSAPGPVPFTGPAREAARLFPDNVNVAVAAALAGPGLDRTRVTVTRHEGLKPRRIRLRAEGGGMVVETSLYPDNDGIGPHPVAGAIIAALKQVDGPIVIF